MAIKRTELEAYADVENGTKDDSQSYAPAGEFTINKMEAQGAFDLNCVVSVSFDGATIWESKGVSETERAKSFTGDGVKLVKLELDCVDLTDGSAKLGGYVLIMEEI